MLDANLILNFGNFINQSSQYSYLGPDQCTSLGTNTDVKGVEVADNLM